MVRYLGAVDREFYFPEPGITMESPVPGSDPYPTWRAALESASLGPLNLNPPEPRDGDTWDPVRAWRSGRLKNGNFL